MEAAERDAMLTLNLVPGLGPTLIRRCIEAFGSAQAALEASIRGLSSVKGISERVARNVKRSIEEFQADQSSIDRERQLIEKHGVTLIRLGEPNYPTLLQHIPDPPPMLYVRGEIREEDALAIAVVGSRRCSQYGREQADRLSGLCAQAGLAIVSGGAYGVDAAAHRAALRMKGRTIAVLGNGLAKPYPDAHHELFDQIVDSGGAVISELPMQTPPKGENFPRRNRLISGLSLGVLVIEAAKRSGALITARLAAEDHGREVMAVPGRVDSMASEGCHKIIRDGWATLVTSGAEILDALGETGQLLKTGLSSQPAKPQPNLFDANLSASQQKIVSSLEDAKTLDELLAGIGLPVQVVQADLTMLQIRGIVTKKGSQYARA